ncbi:FAD-dependent oxidoreductase [Vallicoccus soli]|uniref:D-amino-acid oxidase n=1 Tax=Vallicoccus soli TaxID=2339232 RepID=A0A3A3Z411_9ACTN|nr:FAD-dependent oxidoreductase [Vallicoccus soli]RJK98162.1 FAD-binding oxidoreductase [Vallicoccus soli]
MRVIVIGAGVVGLTVAVRLAEASHDVHVLARDLPLETSSAHGPLLWHPPLPHAGDREQRWADETRAWLAGLEEGAGVRALPGRELRRTVGAAPPCAPSPRRVPPAERPGGYADGWSWDAPVGDPAVHLPWLRGRLEHLGGTLTRASLPAVPAQAGAVVVAAGLASRALGGDPGVVPVREQLVLLDRGGLDAWALDRSEARRPVVVAPYGPFTAVGSALEEGSYDTAPDPDAADALLARARAVVPRLAGQRPVAHRVLLRPGRGTPRVEAEDRQGRRVVHCYGHGTAGWSQAWGCAGEVERLLA